MSDGRKRTHGQIIYLNGTSSSGKSTLSDSLRELFDEPYIHLAIDDHGGNLEQYAASLARTGNNVIIDNVAPPSLTHRPILSHLLAGLLSSGFSYGCGKPAYASSYWEGTGGGNRAESGFLRLSARNRTHNEREVEWLMARL